MGMMTSRVNPSKLSGPWLYGIRAAIRCYTHVSCSYCTESATFGTGTCRCLLWLARFAACPIGLNEPSKRYHCCLDLGAIIS